MLPSEQLKLSDRLIVERSSKSDARYRSDSRHRSQTLTKRILVGELLELVVGGNDLYSETFDDLKKSLGIFRKPVRSLQSSVACSLWKRDNVARDDFDQLCTSPSTHAID